MFLLPSTSEEVKHSFLVYFEFFEFYFSAAMSSQSLCQVIPSSDAHARSFLDKLLVEVIRALVDYGEFVQVQEMFAQSITVGFAAFDGESVGIVANNPMHEAGTLDVDASEKAARFVQFCIPITVTMASEEPLPASISCLKGQPPKSTAQRPTAYIERMFHKV